MMTSSQPAMEKDTHREWIPLLELSAREVFELMLGCHLAVAPAIPGEVFEITAMVGLAGQLCGVLSVRCDEKSATLMASKMLGVEVDKVGADMPDAIGEVCNMIAGNFKNKVSGLGDGCMLSPPSVITGTDYSMHNSPDSSALALALVFENMPIIVSLQIEG